MLPITSPQNPTIKLIRSLADKKGRRDHNLWMAEGYQMLERALAFNWEPVHLIATKPVHLWDAVKPLIISEKLMAELSAMNNPQDVLATFKPWYERSIAQPWSNLRGTYLALEGIRDPGNLGTIFRTAEAAGVSNLVLTDCCDPYSPECVRATTGSIFAFNPVNMSQENLAGMCAKWPGDCVGTSMTAPESFRRPYQEPVLIVLGSESRGLSAPVAAACKTMVSIPMAKGVESLNVATAAALMVYEATK
jgi:TrmH family RNA methyltransferase